MGRSKKLSEDVERELRSEAAAFQQGVSLRPWAMEMAKLHGVSVHTIYRACGSEVSRRKRRSDAGSLKAMETDELADVAALVVKYQYPVQIAIENLNVVRESEGLAPLAVHEETVRRHLRQLGLSRMDKEDRRVHRRWEAPYRGYLYQMDTTPAEQYYIDTDHSIGYESPVLRNKSKAGNGRPRLWLVGVIDDYSRTKWARYFTGNNATVWLNMLTFVMRKGAFGAPDVWPAYGVPERLYTDQDAAMKAIESIDFLEAFGIERMLALPSTEHFTNAQAKGKVERALGHINVSFERVTRARRFEDLDHMNEVLGKFLTHLNSQRHGTTGVAPFERWLQSPNPVVVLPDAEIVRRCSARRAEVRVNSDLTIRMEGKSYQLPRREPFSDFVKHTVSVRYFRADLSRITLILNGEAHEIDAQEAVPDAAGEFKQAPTPLSVELKKSLLERDTSKYDEKVHEIFEARLERDPRSYPIRPEEIAHPLTTAAMAPRMVRKGPAISQLQLAKVISQPPTDAERLALEALFGERREIPEPELKSFIETRRSHDAPPMLRVERS